MACSSPTAVRMLKYSVDLVDDGLVGQQLFAGETTRLSNMTESGHRALRWETFDLETPVRPTPSADPI